MIIRDCPCDDTTLASFGFMFAAFLWYFLRNLNLIIARMLLMHDLYVCTSSFPSEV